MLIGNGVYRLNRTDYSEIAELSPPELLRWADAAFGEKLLIATSFQASGMVILDMAAKISRTFHIITLDTGHLPPETYQMMETVRSRYGFRVEVVSPDPVEVEAMVSLYGTDLFYRDIGLRKLCCEVRKVRPMERKLKEFSAWIAGVRRSQSGSRSATRRVEMQNGLLKLSPLADWTQRQVEEYVRLHGVPMHPLYARGYTSIGCAPCTRATLQGEDERAGRWWWEQDELKECGIHFAPGGGTRRGLDIALEQVLRGASA